MPSVLSCGDATHPYGLGANRCCRPSDLLLRTPLLFGVDRREPSTQQGLFFNKVFIMESFFLTHFSMSNKYILTVRG